ncbi:hypothetical protein [Streptomyces gossypiisoli]|uniref:hypothetical protein n=1 Tax=Streptomyces TaxID=1883 RepID=UPI002F9698A1
MLAVHETAEEEVIHPFTRRAGPGGEKVVEERLREEREARELLSCLDGMDTDGPKFLPEPQVPRCDAARLGRGAAPSPGGAALPCGNTGFAVFQPAGTSPGTLG